jgi:hypothetical protein
VPGGCNPIDLNFRNDNQGPLYINPTSSCFTVPMAPTPKFWTDNCDPAPPSFKGPLPPGDLRCFNLRGNVGRNTLIGPGLTNLDFSVVKNNTIRKISESFNVQFRAELFNILNHANFNVPSLGDGYKIDLVSRQIWGCIENRYRVFELPAIFGAKNFNSAPSIFREPQKPAMYTAGSATVVQYLWRSE